MSRAVEGVAPTLEQVEDWLVANCGKGVPHGVAKDRAGMLHGLAYVLRQIESTNSYKVHIGQCTEATSALRMALEHFARQALTTPPARSYADGVEDAAKVADDYALGALEGGEPLIEATAETIAAAIRLLSQGEKA
jgi:hypothetical protein